MSIVDQVIAAARNEIGKPYLFGAAGPAKFDCSGLITWIFAKSGISLPHNAAEQQRSAKVTKVSAAAAQPGDLVFYGNPAHHVALYLGGGRQIAAPHTGSLVQEQGVSSGATYGRVTGIGLASSPLGGVLADGTTNLAGGVVNASFDVDKFFKQAEGVALNLTVGTLGLALIGGGLVLAFSPQARKGLKQLTSTIGMG